MTRKNSMDFAGFLEESNRLWARGAWALIVTLARTKFVSRERPNKYAFHDTGMGSCKPPGAGNIT